VIQFGLNDMLFLLPIILLFIFACVPLTLKVLGHNEEPNNNLTLSIALVGLVLAAGALVFQWMSREEAGPVTAFGGALIFDRMALYSSLTVLLIGGFTLILSSANVNTTGRSYAEHAFLVLLSMVGMFILNASNDLVVAFIGLETMSIALYVLIGLSHEQLLAKEAAFKYFLLGSFASAVFLYGIAFVYGTTGSTAFSQIAMSADTLARSNMLFAAGAILLMIGIGFKVSMFPFHIWTPDVYQGAPTSISGFMATGVKVAMFTVFLRLVSTDMFLAMPGIFDVLVIFAVLTMTFGNIVAIVQDNIKRMLAYSSIAHGGYLLIGVIAALRADDGNASSATLFYLLAYALMNVGAFAVVSLLEKAEGGNLNIQSYAGLGFKYPVMGMALSVFMFSLAGIPPTAGFMGKFFIFAAAIKEGLVWLAVFGVINSLLSVYYYLRVLMYLYMKPETQVVEASEDTGTRFVVGAAALLTLVIGVFAAPFYNAAFESVTSLFK